MQFSLLRLLLPENMGKIEPINKAYALLLGQLMHQIADKLYWSSKSIEVVVEVACGEKKY